ncbi:hypothetical protein [Sphingomonas bacterium]|uniref:hypothetical protein n=1 Tax=Sphingomonas bacterium TaxID=1895847 RepID=UPI001576A8E0|nr:hypothetical protein [Sphingomonas bacterium]
MADNDSKTTAAKTKTSLASTAASITKNILGVGPDAPKTVKVPQAVSEIHVSPEDMIPPGAVLTEELIALADLTDDDIDALLAAGHVKMIDVYAAPAAA